MEIKAITWTKGAKFSGDAAKAYTAIEAIKKKNGGSAPPSMIVEKAKAKNSPLHRYFEWDDKAAADEYRLEQGRKLVRSIEVTYKETPDVPPVRAFVAVTEPAKRDLPARKVYRSIHDVMSDPVARDEVLANAIRDAIAFRRKYQHLSEFSKVCAVIDDTLDSMTG